MKTKMFFFSMMLLSSVSVVSAANLSGRWTGSSACQYIEFNDSGSAVMGNCNNSGFHHLINGQYIGSSMIQGAITRVDLSNNCKLTIRASITIMDDNQIEFTQYDGWNGCGVATGHGQYSEVWKRAGGSVGLNPPIMPNQPSVTNPTTSPPPSVSGPISGRDRERIEGGYGEVEATFYPQSGRLTATTRAVTESQADGVHAAGFIVGIDQQGQKLFVTHFDIPTSCAKLDFTCRTTTAVGGHEYQVDPRLARYVSQLEVNVTSRGDNAWTRAGNTIRQGYQTYQGLPPEVKSAIAAALL